MVDNSPNIPQPPEELIVAKATYAADLDPGLDDRIWSEYVSVLEHEQDRSRVLRDILETSRNDVVLVDLEIKLRQLIARPKVGGDEAVIIAEQIADTKRAIDERNRQLDDSVAGG